MTRHANVDTYSRDGSFVRTLVPWGAADYLAAIEEIEEAITQRRLREAILTAAGAQWLAAREAEIEALRSEMDALP